MNAVERENDLYRNSVKPMSRTEFERLSDFIVSHCGIKMPPVKKVMLESRLQKRLRALGIASFKQYCDYVLGSDEGDAEIVHMIDAVTTNKTDFFREPVHFQFLSDSALPDFMDQGADGTRRKFRVWSAGCSSGEEPYTLAIVLNEFALQNSDFDYSILATDISTRVLEKARLGIYDEHLVKGIPVPIKQKYFLRSKNREKAQVRLVPEIRSRVSYQRVNLMDEHIALAEPMEAIFCRNVIIYFERATQYRLLSRLCRHLTVGGHLFLGHSETVHGFDLPLVRISSTIYRKTQ